MGGVSLTLTGDTAAEVQRKLGKAIRAGRHEGLYEDRRSEPIYDRETKKFVSYLRLHT